MGKDDPLPDSTSSPGKRIRVQAQRKFAHGAPIIPVQSSKDPPSRSSSYQDSSPKESDYDSPTKSTTENFLTYLMFRGQKTPSSNTTDQIPQPESTTGFSGPNYPRPARDSLPSTSSFMRVHPSSRIISSGAVRRKPKVYIPFAVRKHASQTPYPCTRRNAAAAVAAATVPAKCKTSKAQFVAEQPGMRTRSRQVRGHTRNEATTAAAAMAGFRKTLNPPKKMRRCQNQGVFNDPPRSTRSGKLRATGRVQKRKNTATLKRAAPNPKSALYPTIILSSDDDEPLKLKVAKKSPPSVKEPATADNNNILPDKSSVVRTRSQQKIVATQDKEPPKLQTIPRQTPIFSSNNRVTPTKESSSSFSIFSDSDEEPLASKVCLKVAKKKQPTTRSKSAGHLVKESQINKSEDILKDINQKFDTYVHQEKPINPLPMEVDNEERAKKKFMKNKAYIEKWIEDSKNAGCGVPESSSNVGMDWMSWKEFKANALNPKQNHMTNSEPVVGSKIYDFISENEPKQNLVNVKPNIKSAEAGGDSEGHLFYIPLKGSEHVIEGVAVKLNSEDKGGRVIMRAKLLRPDQQTGPAGVAGCTTAATSTVRAIGSTSTATMGTIAATGSPTATAGPARTSFGTTRAAAGTARATAGTTRATMSSSRATPSTDKHLQVELGKPSANANPFEGSVFRPMEMEFNDPLRFISNISESESWSGLCRIVPPSNFQVDCHLADSMRFTPQLQYVNRLYKRWGESSRHMCAFRKMGFKSVPKLYGIEVDLPKLYNVVNEMGGLQKLVEMKLWLKAAEEMGIPVHAPSIAIRLQKVYWKYLLPFRTLSEDERKDLLGKVDHGWVARYTRMKARAAEPLNPPPRACDEVASIVPSDMEECVDKGNSTTLGAFARLAKYIKFMHFGKSEPSPEEVEKVFWKHVTERNNHICVSAGSIECGSTGYGFPSNKQRNNPMSKHPWNLKVLTNNTGSVLRALGPMIGVTDPTLHVGMMFSSCCWYQDPHGLPWIEYLHQGAPKVWYGVAATFGKVLRSALEDTVPEVCQNKTIWLLSDTAMVPPAELLARGVPVARVVQYPGEYVVVFPSSFISSICTGYSVSESVYFAPTSWLEEAPNHFKAIYESCEPSMFSFQRLIVRLASDPRAVTSVLRLTAPLLTTLLHNEQSERRALVMLGLQGTDNYPNPSHMKMVSRQENSEECHVCRKYLTLSMVVVQGPKRVYYCLGHAASLLRAEPSELPRMQMVFLYSMEKLTKLYDTVMKKVGPQL